MRLLLVSLIAALAPHIFADVQVTTPAPGALLTPGTIQIEWKDSGDTPALKQLSNYVINLCAGGNTQGSFQCTLATLKANGVYGGQNTGKAVGNIPSSAGGDSATGYFLQFVSTSATGAQVINYSPRFGLSGMTAAFPDVVQKGVNAAKGLTAGPQTSKQGAPNAGAGDDSNYLVPYNHQTGDIRYAPMPPAPGTKITKQSARMQYPTSSVRLATTWLGQPNVMTTYTQSQTRSVSSMENTAAPASMPIDDMQKFLNRWKD